MGEIKQIMRYTVIPSRGERERRTESQVFFFGSEQVDMLLTVSIDNIDQRSWPTLNIYGSLTTDLSSTVSTSGSRSAMSLMQE